MHDLDLPHYIQRFDREGYRHALGANPPALIVSPLAGDSGYEPEQWTAVREYLATHQLDYALIDEPTMRPLWVRRR
jgi:hypothetical protein